MSAAWPLAILLCAGQGWRDARLAVVRIVGAGAGRVAAEGTGVVVSPDGLIVTAASAMLSDGKPEVVFADGRRREASVKAIDPQRQLALLQAPGKGLKALAWAADPPAAGTVVYAWSNAFAIAAGDEAPSLQRGTVAGVASLTGVAGLRAATLPGPALLLSFAVSNPNAAGGAVVDPRGRLVGLIGRELRHADTGAWIHYAIPAATARTFVAEATAPSPAPAPALAASGARAEPAGDPFRGFATLFDASGSTPPFVDRVTAKSPAARAGLRPDDLVLFAEGRPVRTCAELRSACAATPPQAPLRLLVERGGELLELRVPPAETPR